MQFRNLNPTTESVCCSGVLSLSPTVGIHGSQIHGQSVQDLSLPKSVIDLQVAEFNQPLEAQFLQAMVVAVDFLPCPGSRH